MEKTCSKCKELRLLSDFGKLNSSPDGLRYDCKLCRKDYREKNKEIINNKHKEWYKDNKQMHLEKSKLYREKNIEAINVQRKEYRTRPEIKELIKLRNKEYMPIKKQKIKEKRQNNINFKISEILRSKVHKMIKGSTTSYQNIIGCDIDFLKKWIEFRFDENMSWDNLGVYWHIDHILPINSFDFKNDKNIKICFHWTNLQPLCAFKNRQKSDKLQLHYYFNNIININRFNTKYKQFLGYQTVNESLQWLKKKDFRYGNNAPYDITSNEVIEIGNQQPSL
jgi:hypothetical protein